MAYYKVITEWTTKYSTSSGNYEVNLPKNSFITGILLPKMKPFLPGFGYTTMIAIESRIDEKGNLISNYPKGVYIPSVYTDPAEIKQGDDTLTSTPTSPWWFTKTDATPVNEPNKRNKENNTFLTPTNIIIGTVVMVGIVLVIALFKRKKDKHK